MITSSFTTDTTARRRRHLAALCAVLIASFAGLIPYATASGANDPDPMDTTRGPLLMTRAQPLQASHVPFRAHALRHRAVDINFERLAGMQAGGREAVNLFDDLTIAVEITSRRDSARGKVFYGELVDDPLGTMTMVTDGGLFGASVHSHRWGHHLILPTAQSGHAVVRVAEPESGQCGVDHNLLSDRDLRRNRTSGSATGRGENLEDASFVDIVVAHTQRAQDAVFGDPDIDAASMWIYTQLLVESANQAYERSDIPMRLRLVGRRLVSYDELPAAEVRSVRVDAGGQDYLTVPTITLSGGGGSGAEAVAVLEQEAIDRIVVTDRGQNYTTPPDVIISGGWGGGAQATARLQGPSVHLGRITETDDGFMDEIHAFRDSRGADLVALIVDDARGSAGIAYIITSRFDDHLAFSVTDYSHALSVFTFAHEVGHNMGSGHDAANQDNDVAYDYSYGWRFTDALLGDEWRTIMAYLPGTRIQNFSNPDISLLGTPTGADLANNALSHIFRALPTANFRLTRAEIWVDFDGAPSGQNGSQAYPYVNLFTAIDELVPVGNGVLKISSGNLDTAFDLSKPMTIEAVDGPVIFGQ